MIIARSLLILLTFIIPAISFAKLNNSESISYSEKGQGNVLVLIHPFPTDQRFWNKQQEVLSKHFRVITLDLWGFGKTNMINTDKNFISMDEYAQEVKMLMDHLHIKKAIIGGESMGGRISLAFLKHYPNNVQGLILSNTESVADNDEARMKRLAIADSIEKQDKDNFLKTFLGKAISSNSTKAEKEMLKNIFYSQKTAAIAAAWRGIAYREDTTLALKEARIPVLIITSDEDKVISPDQSYNMYKTAKYVNLASINHAGHLSSFEAPDQWNQAVLNWAAVNKLNLSNYNR